MNIHINKPNIIMVGISGSGKSTWARAYQSENPEYMVLSRDDFREALFGSRLKDYYQSQYLHKRETNITNIINSCMSLPFPKIIDNTNLKREYLKDIIARFQTDNFVFKIMNESVYNCKNMVCMRDYFDNIRLDDPILNYIDRQYYQFKEIVKYIKELYPNKILE